MALTQGMNVSKVREVAGRLKTDADQLTDLVSQIQTTVNTIGENWNGTDAGRYIADWNQHSRGVQHCADQLRQMAKQADLNANQQEHASR